MSYAILSLPNEHDLASHPYYLEAHSAYLERKADKYAAKRGLNRGTDYGIYLAKSAGELSKHLNMVRQCKLVYLDAHGSRQEDRDGHVGSKIDIPGSKRGDHYRRDVWPVELDLRESAVELLVVGSCYQEADSWTQAVPPGCVVIGYSKKLYGIYHRHLYERFVELRQLLKDDRSPHPQETTAWQEHIVKWFGRVAPTATPPEAANWFITVGKH